MSGDCCTPDNVTVSQRDQNALNSAPYSIALSLKVVYDPRLDEQAPLSVINRFYASNLEIGRPLRARKLML